MFYPLPTCLKAALMDIDTQTMILMIVLQRETRARVVKPVAPLCSNCLLHSLSLKLIFKIAVTSSRAVPMEHHMEDAHADSMHNACTVQYIYAWHPIRKQTMVGEGHLV